MSQTDLDALDRMVAEAEAAPILWASRAAFIWNAYPALAAELREARKQNETLMDALFGSEGIAIDGELGPTKENFTVWLDARDRRMKALGAAEWLKNLAGDADGDIRVTHEWLRERAAELEAAAGEGEGDVS
ncbi:MAG: hypothetical protein ABFD89_22145 [Bryobacteraceae bacterium]